MERCAIIPSPIPERIFLKQGMAQYVARVAPLILVVTTGSILAAETHEVQLERNVTAKMRDGITLYAEICRPEAQVTFSFLLERTPYPKRDGVYFCLKAAARWTGFVILGMPGRGASERGSI